MSPDLLSTRAIAAGALSAVSLSCVSSFFLHAKLRSRRVARWAGIGLVVLWRLAAFGHCWVLTLPVHAFGAIGGRIVGQTAGTRSPGIALRQRVGAGRRSNAFSTYSSNYRVPMKGTRCPASSRSVRAARRSRSLIHDESEVAWRALSADRPDGHACCRPPTGRSGRRHLPGIHQRR